jgi:hypothetical protein
MDQELMSSAAIEPRCPYCHEGVRPSEPDKQACTACMAWHHSACLEEHGACATCGAQVARAAANGDAPLRTAYGRLLRVLAEAMILLGAGTGGLVAWSIGAWAAELIVLGAVLGLVASRALSARFVGATRQRSFDEALPLIGSSPASTEEVGAGSWLSRVGAASFVGGRLGALLGMVVSGLLIWGLGIVGEGPRALCVAVGLVVGFALWVVGAGRRRPRAKA